ncbi:hypothetical protein ACG7TL_006647 [Trametes sanguinea]
MLPNMINLSPLLMPCSATAATLSGKPFRKTRSGASFSPWALDFGAPVHAPADFDLDARVRAATTLEAAAEHEQQAEEDDPPLESAPPSNGLLSAALLHSHEGLLCLRPPPSESPSDSKLGEPSVQHLSCSHSVPPIAATPLCHEALPLINSGPASQPAVLSKEKFHSKKRSKDRRRKKRAKAQTMGGDTPTNRPVKAIALKRRAAALALHLSAARDEEAAPAIRADGANTRTDGSVPINTSYSLDMEDVPVAKAAFIAARCNVGLSSTGKDESSQSWADAPGIQQASHRRGNYTAVSVGISFGGGQKRVSNLAHAKHNQAVIGSLLQQTSIRRIAAFGDTFSCSTFNLGPQTRTVPHRDHLNLPYGWCAITAFGNFDPKQGGHIILWDLRMVIEFPPGSTILIPSAILMHSNTAIAPEERRYSFTQYTPGGVFRWVASGFQTVKEAGLSARSLNAAGRKRWEEGVGLLSLWSELCAE